MNKRGICNDTDYGSHIIVWILVLIILVAAFEAMLWIYGFILADEVECNLLWCTFTKENHQVTISQECYQNGEQVNCSEIERIELYYDLDDPNTTLYHEDGVYDQGWEVLDESKS